VRDVATAWYCCWWRVGGGGGDERRLKIEDEAASVVTPSKCVPSSSDLIVSEIIDELHAPSSASEDRRIIWREVVVAKSCNIARSVYIFNTSGQRVRALGNMKTDFFLYRRRCVEVVCVQTECVTAGLCRVSIL